MADANKMREALEALRRARDKAMFQTVKTPIPLCAEFADIAQDVAHAIVALSEQPAQGEAVYTMDQMRAYADDFHRSRIQDVSVAYWGAVDSDGTLQMTMSADDANGGLAARQEVNDWINETIAEDGVVTRLVALYTAPPAPSVPAQGATATGPRFTYGHCADRRQVGGCTRHNLYCGYPDCDRKEVPRG